jgi:hypothetical protein
MSDEEFPQFEFPEITFIKISDIRVMIFEEEVIFPNLGKQRLQAFAHKLPYKDQDGGRIVVQNAFKNRLAQKEYATDEDLNRSFDWLQKDILKKNPSYTLLYKGILGRDESYGKSRRFEF